MGYDTWIEDSAGNTLVDIGHYTSNIAAMMDEAISMTFKGFDGRATEDVAVLCYEAIRVMVENPKKYQAMNPEGGWCDFAGLIQYMRETALACEKYPDNVVVVSY